MRLNFTNRVVNLRWKVDELKYFNIGLDEERIHFNKSERRDLGSQINEIEVEEITDISLRKI